MAKRNAGFHMTSITFAFQKISYRKENDVKTKFLFGDNDQLIYFGILMKDVI